MTDFVRLVIVCLMQSPLGISVTREEAEHVAQKFSAHGGSIRFRDFCRVLVPPDSHGNKEDDYVMVRHILDGRCLQW